MLLFYCNYINFIPSKKYIYFQMGPNPVNFQIVSNQEKNFRNGVNGVVNYEDEFYSVGKKICIGVHIYIYIRVCFG